ncbi:MAG: cellulase family glycosylhydrolase [Clostridia bacterium]|nr:cellulase family glycosylhydrolase [Clostridia bacterium]
MERLQKIGHLKAASAQEIGWSRLGVGFEKLDRKAFDPENAYQLVGDLGVHYVRLQSGWQRTEREKGVYDFAWLDAIVDRFLAQGQEPWIDLCYGNDLYTESAKTYYGAVGCPPIGSDEEKAAWACYVETLAAHFAGRVTWYEIWNEADGQWCWKHGPNAAEFGDFTVETARAIRRADPKARVIGGVVSWIQMPFLKGMLDRGVGDAVDALSFHRYKADELSALQEIRAMRALINQYNPKVAIIQGESGTQSDSRGAGALRGGSWTELKQAKYTLRHRLLDLSSEVLFTSQFSALDMVEALNGMVGDQKSWLDFGYFGLLHADFDEDGMASGTYSPKMSYYAMQHLATLFRADVHPKDLPVLRRCKESPRVFGYDDSSSQFVMLGFERDSGAQAIAYWKAVDLMQETFEGTVSLEFGGETRDIRLIDLMTGDVYAIPENMITRTEDGVTCLNHLPLTDSPLLITLGDFVH